MEELSETESHMLDLVVGHLEASGRALTTDQLVAELPALRDLTADLRSITVGQGAWTEYGLVLETVRHVQDLLDDVDHELGWLPDDRWYAPVAVCLGATATVRLDEDALSRRALRLDADLAPLAAVLHHPRPVASGGRTVPLVPDVADPEDDVLVQLPEGALPTGPGPGGLIALRWSADTLWLSLVDEPDADASTEAAAALASAHADLAALGWGRDGVVEVEDVVVVAQVDEGTFDRAQLPVTELLELAQLSVFGDHVGPGDHDWDGWVAARGGEAAALSLGLQYGLDVQTSQMLALAIHAVESELDGADPSHEPPATGPVDAEDVATLLQVLQDPSLAVALGTQTAFVEPELADGLWLLAERLRRRARGRDAAVAHFLLAVAAEGRGLAEDAAKHARLAVRADALHGPSALTAARFAGLRGRAGEALRHLHGPFEPRPGDLLEDALRTHASPGPTCAPRNAACPCGSGRKHKQCCAASNGWPVGTRTHWLLARLREHASGPHHHALLADLVDTMLAPVAHRLDDDAFDALFANAFVHGLVLWEGGALEHFLELFAPLLPPDELEMARGWVGTGLELWEVVDTDPGHGVMLLGLTTGDRVEVPDLAFSRGATLGATVLARVLDAADHLEIQAARPVSIAERDQVLAMLASDDRGDPFAWASVLAMRMPTLTTRDGDPFEVHVVTYSFDVDAETVTAALRMLFLGDVEHELAWVDPEDNDAIVRGTLIWDGAVLEATTTSASRRAELETILAEVFGDAIEMVDEQVDDVDELLTRADAGERSLDGLGVEHLPEEIRDEALEIARRYLREAEERWVDEPVPALGGMTPREALVDPTRRSDLLALLDEFDDHTSRAAPGQTFDVTRLRELLGLR